MTEQEKFDLYETLKKNRVSVHKEQYKLIHAQHYYTDTVYSFGTYKIIETIHAPDSKFPWLYFITIFKGNRPLGGWCQKQMQESKDIHDMYMAAKNKEKQYQ